MVKKIILLIISIILLSFNSVCAETNGNGFLVKVKNLKENNAVMFENLKDKTLIGNNLFLVEDKSEIEKLNKIYEIEYIEPNYEVCLFDDVKDPMYLQQWNLKMINAEFSREIGCFGNEIRIALVDSGIFPHEDINNNVLKGFNFLWKTENEKTNTNDDIGHGSFISGIIASEMNNVGIVGISGMAKIVPLKCFNSKSTLISNVIPAIYAAVNTYNCDIINLSFGGPDSESLKSAIDYAVGKGAIIVAAVGNYGNTNLYFPAAYDNVIGVSSVNVNKQKAKTSQMNKSVFVTAPGEQITSIGFNNSYTISSGTSYSAPVVTAMAAIAKNIKKDITLNEFKNALVSSSEDLGDIGYDTSYGNGLVNVKNFINTLLKDQKIFVSPIDSRGNTLKIKIFNNTDEQVELTNIFADYSDKKLENVVSSELIIPQKQTETIEYSKSYTSLKHFIWQSFSQMTPLYKSKIIR